MRVCDVAATLEGGRVVSGFFKGLFYSIPPMAILEIVLCVVLFPSYVASLGVGWAVFCAVVCFTFFGGFAMFSTYILRKNKKLEILVEECMADAILLRADVEEITDSLVDRIYNGAKIQVRFTYNGKKFLMQSGYKNSTKRTNGYDKVFVRYVNRNVEILFSPSKRQVMFLRN